MISLFISGETGNKASPTGGYELTNGKTFMKNNFFRMAQLATALILLSACFHAIGEEPGFTIIPKPLSLKVSQGSFSIDARTSIIADAHGQASASYLAERLRKATGFELPIRPDKDGKNSNAIVLRLYAASRESIGTDRESYQLSVTPERADISASAPAGLFHGVQTLLQMFPPRVYAQAAELRKLEKSSVPFPPRVYSQAPTLFTAAERTIPSVEISDRPRFPWRGLMIDVSRHFFSKEQLKKTIAAMAIHKLNVLHLHLTDDPGWRIEIEQYPRLTNVGAIGDLSNPGGPERFFFSKEDIREIVEHARQRHIMVVPEIDMPGHAMAAARAYPEFFDGYKTFNPMNKGTYEFVRNVLTEVMELFPSGYLHFGGDEVRDQRWADMPELDRFMQEHGYTSLREVEGHFDRFVSDFIVESGYTPIGWDEVAEFDVNPGTIVQWWLHLRPEARDLAVRKGHRIIISPTNYLYFDYPNGPGEPGAPWEGNDNGPNSFELIHQWEPVPKSYSREEESQVLGLQANLWTEFVKSNEYYEYMIFPRLSALAEIAWSPKGKKDLDDFRRRLHIQCQRYAALGLNYRVFGEWPSDFSYMGN